MKYNYSLFWTGAVIVLSGAKSKAEIESYYQLGALDYLVKPDAYASYLEMAKGIAERVLNIQLEFVKYHEPISW